MLSHPSIKIGDRARFPPGRLGDADVYRHSFEAIAFTRDGLIRARRLCDGVTRELSITWWERYTLDDRPKRQTERKRLPLPRLNVDRAREGFYVSIKHAHKPGAYILAAGPFSYPGDADRMVTRVKAHVDRTYGSTREWWDMRFGTCKVQDGSRDGKFNQELGLCQ